MLFFLMLIGNLVNESSIPDDVFYERYLKMTTYCLKVMLIISVECLHIDKKVLNPTEIIAVDDDIYGVVYGVKKWKND